MEAMIIASYVLTLNREGRQVGSEAFYETSHERARSTLASVAASLAGVAIFAVALSLLG